MTSIFDLKDEVLDKKRKKHSIYDTIYDKVINRIKFVNKNTNKCYCVYKFSGFDFGLPLYNVNECISYVNHKLRKNKYKVGIYAKNKIIISWLHIFKQKTAEEELINNHISLLDVKEQQELDYIEKMKQMQEIDNEYIKYNSHMGNILDEFPLYNTQHNTKYNTQQYNTQHNNGYKTILNKPNYQLTYGQNINNGQKLKSLEMPLGNNKAKQNSFLVSSESKIKDAKSLELDALLSEFDNNSLL